MSLKSLVQQNYRRYLSDCKDPAMCWFFVHIPKTAGSSFQQDLRSIRGPSYNVHVDDDDRPVPYQEKLVDAVRRFDESFADGKYRFASGHVPITTLTAHMQNWHELSLVTMLRDPVQRVTSDYRYQRTPLHPGYQEFVGQFPSLESYARVPWAQNRMFQFLRPTEDASVDDCIDFVVDRFAFVGITEMYPLSTRLVGRLMGEERTRTSQERQTPNSDANRVEVSQELLRRLRKLNAIDVMLYEFFRALLMPMRRVVQRAATDMRVPGNGLENISP